MNGDTMVGFGSKQAWLAIRDGEPGAVAAALGLRDLGPVRWREGIDLSYFTDDRVALTPPLAGAGEGEWLLVVGRWLLLATPEVDVVPLSAALDTEVQSFATHRVAEAHRWQRAVRGRLIRAFGFRGETGEVTRWEGEPDPVELALGLPAAGHGAPNSDVLVGEGDVMRIAAAWSVDPAGLGGRPAPGPLRVYAV